MAINQGLIAAAGKMGGSTTNTGAGIVKAIGAIGRYVAAKKKIFQAATAGFNAVEEDVPLDQLPQYKTRISELAKTIKNVPAFMPKYKKAVEEYNDIMKQVSDFKTQTTELAKSKIGMAENAKDLSSYQSNGTHLDLHTDVVTESYTAFMDTRGPMMRFENGTEMLIADYLKIKPEFISESKDLSDEAYSLIETHGTLDKINGVNRAAGSVAQEVTGHAEKVFTQGNHATNILFNKKFVTPNGKKTFMDWLAFVDDEGSSVYNKLLEDVTVDQDASDEPRSATQTVTLTTEDIVDGSADMIKRGLWEKYPGGLEALEEKYNEFLMMNIKHQKAINTTRVANSKNKSGNPTVWDLEEEYKMFPGIASQGRGYVDYADYNEEDKKYGVVRLFPQTGQKIQNQYDDITQKTNAGDEFFDFLANKYTVVGTGDKMTYKVTSPGGTTRMVIDPQTNEPITQQRLLETLIDPSVLRLIPGHMD
tara:strand:+ start:7636 stop:9066 length:1431 start_codon:yes stop_codon:yes gene_type:complete